MNQPELYVVCVIFGGGEIVSKFLFLSFLYFFFFFFRFIYFSRKTRLDDDGCVRGVGDDGGRVICDTVIDEMRSDCIFHGSGNGSRSKARETRAFSTHVSLRKTRFLAYLTVCLCLRNFDCRSGVHNLKIRG